MFCMKKTMPRRLVSLVLCCLLWVSLVPVAGTAADETRDLSSPQALAGGLEQLGLFRGISKTGTDFDLGRVPTRAEALVMLIRLLGKEDEALGGNTSTPFTDVPAWAGQYVGYAYENGLTQGVSASKFDPDGTVGANIYLTFLLRALGYSDENGTDFTWRNPYALATSCGILPVEADINRFLRADAVLTSYAALSALRKTGGGTLADKLISGGVFTRGQYDAAFDSGAFSDSAAIHFAVSAAILENGEGGSLTPYEHRTESHIILDTVRDGGTVRCTVLTCCGFYHYSKALPKTFLKGSQRIQFAEIALNPLSDGSYKTAEYKSGIAALAEAEAVFSPEVLQEYQSLSQDVAPLCSVCSSAANQYAADVFDVWQPTYEEARAEILGSQNYIALWEYEGDGCTVLYGVTDGSPHGPRYNLDILWLDGNTKHLPVPDRSTWGAEAEPEHIRLSEGGGTLSYDVTFSDRLIIDEGLPSERLIHEKGTYYYTVNLLTGEVSLTITDK